MRWERSLLARCGQTGRALLALVKMARNEAADVADAPGPTGRLLRPNPAGPSAWRPSSTYGPTFWQYPLAMLPGSGRAGPADAGPAPLGAAASYGMIRR